MRRRDRPGDLPSQHDVTVDLEMLGMVLERELEAGCIDALVEGGLDEMLRLQARDEPPGSPLLRMVGRAPGDGVPLARRRGASCVAAPRPRHGRPRARGGR